MPNINRDNIVNVFGCNIWNFNKKEPEYEKSFSTTIDGISGSYFQRPSIYTVYRLINGAVCFSLKWREIKNIENVVILLDDPKEISSRMKFYGFRSVDDEFNYRVSHVIGELKKDVILVHCHHNPSVSNLPVNSKMGEEKVYKEIKEGRFIIYQVDLYFIRNEKYSFAMKSVEGYYSLTNEEYSSCDKYFFGFYWVDDWRLEELVFEPDSRIKMDKNKYKGYLLCGKSIMKDAFDENVSWLKEKSLLDKGKAEVDSILYNKNIPVSPAPENIMDFSDW